MTTTCPVRVRPETVADGIRHDHPTAVAVDHPTAVTDLDAAADPDGTASALHRCRACRDAGMATAEYAIATVAAAGFAGLLLLILRSDEVRGLLLGIIRGALSV